MAIEGVTPRTPNEIRLEDLLDKEKFERRREREEHFEDLEIEKTKRKEAEERILVLEQQLLALQKQILALQKHVEEMNGA